MAGPEVAVTVMARHRPRRRERVTTVIERVFWKSASREEAIDRAWRTILNEHREREFLTTLGRWTLTRLLDAWAASRTRSPLDGG
jgi:hypothetical protein